MNYSIIFTEISFSQETSILLQIITNNSYDNLYFSLAKSGLYIDHVVDNTKMPPPNSYRGCGRGVLCLKSWDRPTRPAHLEQR